MGIGGPEDFSSDPDGDLFFARQREEQWKEFEDEDEDEFDTTEDKEPEYSISNEFKHFISNVRTSLVKCETAAKKNPKKEFELISDFVTNSIREMHAANKQNFIPENTLKVLRMSKDLDEFDTTEDKEFRLYSKSEIFESLLEWEGIIGYMTTLGSWIKDIYNIDLDSIDTNFKY